MKNFTWLTQNLDRRYEWERKNFRKKQFKVVETDGIIFWGKKEESIYFRARSSSACHCIVLLTGLQDSVTHLLLTLKYCWHLNCTLFSFGESFILCNSHLESWLSHWANSRRFTVIISMFILAKIQNFLWLGLNREDCKLGVNFILVELHNIIHCLFFFLSSDFLKKCFLANSFQTYISYLD